MLNGDQRCWYSKSVVFVLFSALAAFLVLQACQSPLSVAEDRSDLRLALPSATARSVGIESWYLKATGPDDRVLEQAFSSTLTTVSLSDLPVGSWLFLLEGRSADGVVLYRATTQAELVAGTNQVIMRPQSTACAITAFAFEALGVWGTINEADATISVVVNSGTDLSSLVPSITITGASVTPETGVAQDFSDPVVYTVTAADGTTKSYTVSVSTRDVRISLAAIPGVVLPVRGAVPATTAIDSLQYTGTIAWSPAHSLFEASTVYTATITLSPKTGFTLSGVEADFFTVAGADSVKNAADSGVVTAVFPATAAPSAVAVSFQSLEQVGGSSGSADSTALTLGFDVDPTTLSIDDITVTGATKGALSGTGTTRTLAISNITVANGEAVSVTVNSPAGFSVSGSPRTAVVYRVQFSVSYHANDATSGTVPASQPYHVGDVVTAAFNSGSLARTAYTFGGWNTQADGNGTDYAAGSGSFSMPGSNLVLYAKWVIAPLSFISATQVGGTDGVIETSGLLLSFDIDPVTLTAADITLAGATKGALSGTGTTRTLAISNITVANGATVSVSIASPPGYALSGSPKNATVYRDLPAGMAGLKYWIKADAGVYTDAGTTAASDGQPVQQWNDQSGNPANLHVTQATATNKPIFVSNAIGGRPALQFDNDDTLGLASVLGSDLTAANEGTFYVVNLQSSADSDGGTAFVWWAVNIDTNRLLFHIPNGSLGQIAFDFGNTTIGDGRLAWGIPGSFDTFHINELYRHSGSDSSGEFADGVWLDGANNLIGNFTSVLDNALSGPLIVGHGSVGQIAELIFFNRALSTAERTQVKNYLSAKYGIAVQ